MKKLLPVAVAALLGGCASIDNLNPFAEEKRDFTVAQPVDNTTAVKDVTVGTWNEEGIKIFYTLGGDLERIEVYGIAPAWKGNVEIVAEADAKERLVKYLYDNQVNSRRSVEVLTRTLDKARDNALNDIENGRAPQSVVNFKEEEVESEVAANPTGTIEDNTSRRVAERLEETKISALTRITAGGALRGVRKIRSGTRDNGKIYVAVYQWSEEDQAVANTIRSKMFGK
jgi:hypothetical protein